MIEIDDVTIGIPCYNHEKYIEFCLESIINEGYPNKKILIIDDGSTDNSVKLIQQWHRNNPAVPLKLVSRENQGLNSTLNQLIELCDSEFFCMLASDDGLYPGGLMKRIQALKSNPTKMAVIGDALVIDENNTVIFQSAIEELYHGNKEQYKTDDSLQRCVIHSFSVPGAVLLFRKKLFQVIGPYPRLFAEDIFFYLRVAGLKLLLFVDEPVGYYRKHAKNTTGNRAFSRAISKTFIVSYWENIKFYPFSLQLQIIKKLLGRIYLYLRA